MDQIHRHCRSTALMLGLTFCLLIEGGCAAVRPSVTSFWKQVPSVRWTSKERDSGEVAEKKGATKEPAVAANVAVKVTPIEEPSSTEETTGNKRRKSAYTRSDNRPGQFEAWTNDNSSVAGKDESGKPTSEMTSETRRAESSMERLNAALSDDALQSQALPQTILTDLDLRIRVDSLLSQAKQFLEVGQLDEAHRVAQNAHELGETTQLDYSPDQERPIDLVRLIEDRLEEIQLQDEPPSFRDMTESPTSPIIWESIPPGAASPDKQDVATNASKPAATTTSAAKDATGLARIRRDWSTLFRREKKPVGLETDPVAQNFNAAQPTAPKDLRTQTELVNRPSDSESRAAIVMANRSVSLGTSESVTMSSAATSDVPSTDSAESIETRLTRSDAMPLLELGHPDISDQRDTSSTVIADPSKQADESEESSIVPPDFHIVESAAAFDDNSRLLIKPPRPELVDADETDRQSDWTFYYIGFGVCSLVAIHWYRRGAT